MKQLLLILILLASLYSQAISLPEAIKQKLVTAEVIGNDANSKGYYASSHSGACMHLLVKNISGKAIDVMVETGQTFQPEDTLMQPMIVTKHKTFQLPTNGSSNDYLYAMCFNQGKSSPGVKSIYKVSKVATGALLQTAQYVEKSNLQDWQGQGLIWESVSRNCFDCLFVRQPVAKPGPHNVVLWDSATVYHERAEDGAVFHKLSPDSVAKSFRNWYSNIDVKFNYELLETSKVTVELTDESGKIVKEIYKDIEQPAGTHHVHETLVIDNDWRLKKFKLYLYVNGKLKMDRELRLKQADNVKF